MVLRQLATLFGGEVEMMDTADSLTGELRSIIPEFRNVNTRDIGSL